MLWNDTERREAKLGDGACQGIWQDGPEALVDKIHHFFLKEVQKFRARLVGAS